jgi:hypothetical protein
VTRPRAADDFPTIRARMEELRRERARPRAADDFAMIRARMEELRRERAQVSAEVRNRPAPHPSGSWIRHWTARTTLTPTIALRSSGSSRGESASPQQVRDNLRR